MPMPGGWADALVSQALPGVRSGGDGACQGDRRTRRRWVSLLGTRETMRRGFADAAEEATERELVEQDWMRKTEDFKEGIKSYAEKRVGNFKGRAETMAQLAGKAAIVTGGASGIGEACAETLAREGASVLVTDVDDHLGKGVVERIARAGGTARYLHQTCATRPPGPA